MKRGNKLDLSLAIRQETNIHRTMKNEISVCFILSVSVENVILDRIFSYVKNMKILIIKK